MQRRAMILGVCALLACGEPPTSSVGGPEEPAPLPTLTTTPSQSPPGGIVALSGFDAGSLTGEMSVTIAGRAASARVTEDGDVLAAVPLFVAADGSASDPPADPVDVTLYSDGIAVAEAAATLKVTARRAAPGALDDVRSSLTQIVESLRVLSLSVEPTPGVEQAYATVTLDAVEELLTGDNEYSLAHQLALLEASDGGEKELIEGWLAASGVLDQLETVAELTAQVSAAMRATAPPSAMARATELADWDLAARMQLYVMVRDFGAQVLGQTATTWGQTVGLAAGAGGLVVSVPFFGVVSAGLGVASFAINNVALAYLPAKVDSFRLVLGQPFVFSGEVAETEIWIEASNSPPSITVLDLVDLVLNAMGFGASPDRETFRGIIVSVTDFYLARVRSLMSAYGQAHPEADIAFDVASIPSMTWRARVTDVRYVTPKSRTPAVIDANGLDILAWRAGIEAAGEGRIYASINFGPEALSIPLIPGYEYNAGAFGDDILDTETMSVEVGPPLVVTASMSDTISEGGINGLEVRAGTTNPVGDTIWQAGMAVTLNATGGSVDPASGVTGEDGRFDTFVTLDAGSDSVVVDITVTGANGFQVETTAAARAGGGFLVVDARFPEIMEPGDTADLYVDVYRADANGQEGEPFANILLDVTGGTAVETVGNADDEGWWRTRVTLDPGADEVSVTIRASTVDGLAADTTVRARNLDNLPIRVVAHSSRAWLNTSGTGGPLWRLYRDNFYDLLAPSTGVNWTYSSTGAREGKTCQVTTSLDTRSELRFDDATGVLAEWSSTSEGTSAGSAQGLTEFNNPGCSGNTQVQLSLRFRINEGSWRVTWNGEQTGESGEEHANWSSRSSFRDVNEVSTSSPPDATLAGQVVLGPGEYDFWINPYVTGGVGSYSAASAYLATGGHTLDVTFERVGGFPVGN